LDITCAAYDLLPRVAVIVAMSFGASPSDVVQALETAVRAISSLKEEGGSKSRYQTANASLQARVAALEAIVDITALSSNASSSAFLLQQLASSLRDRDKELLVWTGKYQKSLSEQAPKGWRHSVGRKLQYAFDGHGKLQDHFASTQPEADAAILHSIL
jgi:hypothetical protein